jgi:hypothetical protein
MIKIEISEEMSLEEAYHRIKNLMAEDGWRPPDERKGQALLDYFAFLRERLALSRGRR